MKYLTTKKYEIMGSHKSQADNALHQYDDAVDVIKQAILKSQYRSVKLITGEQLSLYFGIIIGKQEISLATVDSQILDKRKSS